MYTQHTRFSTQTVWIEFEGQPIEVPNGISVAAAVLGYVHEKHCRRAFIGGEKRAPFCLMGVCHECFMEINGQPYQQACMIPVEEGMRIKKQDFTHDG